MSEFTCDACHGTFEYEEGWDAQAEADEVYLPGELERDGAVEVCDECFKQMRAAIPEMEARYSEKGL